MSQRVRALSVALVMVTAVALTACSSDSSATSNGDDVQRNAAGMRGTTLCVSGRTGSPMTVYLSKIDGKASWVFIKRSADNDPKQTGPFSLSFTQNPCIFNDWGQVRMAMVLATVYSEDGTRAFWIAANNPGVGEPEVGVECNLGPSDVYTHYTFSEGLHRSYDCGQFAINVERMTDSETEKHFQVNVGLR